MNAANLSKKKLQFLLEEAQHDIDREKAKLPLARTVLEANRINSKIKGAQAFVTSITNRLKTQQ